MSHQAEYILFVKETSDTALALPIHSFQLKLEVNGIEIADAASMGNGFLKVLQEGPEAAKDEAIDHVLNQVGKTLRYYLDGIKKIDPASELASENSQIVTFDKLENTKSN